MKLKNLWEVIRPLSFAVPHIHPNTHIHTRTHTYTHTYTHTEVDVLYNYVPSEIRYYEEWRSWWRLIRSQGQHWGPSLVLTVQHIWGTIITIAINTSITIHWLNMSHRNFVTSSDDNTCFNEWFGLYNRTIMILTTTWSTAAIQPWRKHCNMWPDLWEGCHVSKASHN